MKRKQVLIAAVGALAAVGFLFVAYVFVASLQPSAKAKALGYHSEQYDVRDLDPGNYRIIEHMGKPYYVRRAQDSEYLVLELLSHFEVVRYPCLVRLTSDYAGYSPEGAVFVEGCRPNFYASDGKVMMGSHPEARPLSKPRFRITNGHIVFDADT